MVGDITGLCPDRFARVREAFEANFADGGELGARFSFAVDGEIVVDLMGGFADRKREVAFGPDTLTALFSTTKAVAALMIARLVDEGRLAYDQPVADVWPEFAQAGKGQVTVEQALSHQAGLSGFPDQTDPALWFDWDATCAKLAAMAPLFPIGSASGYHPVTYGYLAGEIFRRVDGRTMGTALREDICDPLGLDLWIGLPDSEHGRVADLMRPTALPKFGELNAAVQAAFLKPWSSPGGRSAAEWRRIEIPSANGHATAEALARLMGALATDGTLGGRSIITPAGVKAASAQRIIGQDLVLPFVISWGAGFMRNEPNMFYGPTPEAFGHSGWGGSCAFADPTRGVSGAYVMNKQGAALIGDPRAVRLIEAAYASL
ncbi:serine hydrolase domain-containing protein [Caulobacter sp. FWC2]|uniref:serine hydrolase domain-containing protein n=1 Tax=Caulobacter sp. FWC2 TaxID=69664 RepID=UPI000C147BD3|nr:serine hydrolase domain-containing protein [Caulobacter sp. FWC2]PIB90316.1 esterase [Caulobacter sp. FWC2]